VTYLLNSAVLAAGAYGAYTFAAATWEDLREALASREIVSRIGYPETADLVFARTGWRPDLSRETSALAPGDSAFVVRLRYRLATPTRKGCPTQATDEAWEVAYLSRQS